MKLNKQPSKKIAIILIISLLVAAGVSTYFIIRQNDDSAITRENAEKQQKADNEAKKDFIENTNEDGSSAKDTPAPDPTPSDGEDNPVKLSVRTEPNGTVTALTQLGSLSGGTCTLQVTNGTNTVSKIAPVIYQEQFSSCAGFSLASADKTSLGTGTWQFALSVSSGGNTYTAKVSSEVN